MPITCKFSPPTPCALNLHFCMCPWTIFLFTSDTVAPVSTRQRFRCSPNVALTKTAVGKILFIGIVLSSRADPRPNSRSAPGSFPGVVVVGLGTNIDNHWQNVQGHHTQNSNSCSGVAQGHFFYDHFFTWVVDIRSQYG